MSTTSPEAIARALRAAAADGTFWLEVSGSSMGRSIPSGSRVRLRVDERPRRGEVWVFADDDGNLLTHRYVGRRGSLYLFQGDGAAHPDRPVSADRLIAAVTAIESTVGHRRRPGPYRLLQHLWWSLRRLERRIRLRDRADPGASRTR